MSVLMEKYRKELVPGLMKELGFDNPMRVPSIRKIVVNMRISSKEERSVAVEDTVKILSAVTGQHPVACPARQSVAGFKIRKGDIVGYRVTLRGRRMYEFLERLIHIAIPRIKDFRGLDPDAFDGRGNYTMGVDDCFIFPEVDPDSVKRSRGMDVVVVTSARTDQEGRALLTALGFPFAR